MYDVVRRTSNAQSRRTHHHTRIAWFFIQKTEEGSGADTNFGMS